MNKCLVLLLLFYGTDAFAASQGSDPIAPIIFWVTLIFFFGLIGRYLAIRLKQPQVIGELMMGVVLGNLGYFFGLSLAVILHEGPGIYDIMQHLLAGSSLSVATSEVFSDPKTAAVVLHALSGEQGFQLIKIASIVDVFSRYGVIFLLFMVGLESSLDLLKRTGQASFRVAVIGVLAPMLLSILVTLCLMPTASFNTALFIAATLSATSVGITASVLKEMKKLGTREAQTILGAAIVDDVLGLILLAIVSSIVVTGVVSVGVIFKLVVYAFLFFAVVFMCGPFLLRRAVSFFKFLDPWEAKLCVAFLLVMGLSWLATLAQLATIIGAFAAGLILHEGYFNRETVSIKALIAPLEAVLAPLFFMLIGLQVKLELFLDPVVLYIASGLTLAAILGKLVSGLGGHAKDDRLLIGFGMLPRGEVGLIFASIGRTLGVLSDQVFSAIILMVIITTLLAPPLLKQRFARHEA